MEMRLRAMRRWHALLLAFVCDPLIRDGGAMLSRRYSLYSLTGDRDLDNFNSQLDKIVE